jgi:predicted dehydrogenase
VAQLQVGVIGVGGIARTHMPGWVASEQAEVVAGADISADALQGWGEKWEIQRLTTDSAELLDDPEIDIVDICTPNNYHAPLAIAALRAGKHVICEKPLAPAPDAIRDMIAARDASGKLLMTAQHFRFRGSSRAMKAEIDRGALGDIYHARSWLLRRAAAPTRPGFIMREHSSGGPCIDVGVHVLDLTLWFMGNPKPVSVTGVARAELARFENGATLILEVSWMLHHETGDRAEDMQMWLYGTKGGSHWPRCEIYESNNETRQHYNRSLRITNDTLEAHALECVEFARAVAEGGPSPVPAEESLQVMAILDGVYRSQNAGGEVQIEL